MKAVKLPVSLLFIALLLCSCTGRDPISMEGKITGIESLNKSDYLITIEDRVFLFNANTYYIDSWTGLFSGKTNVRVDNSIVGRYCLAGWGKKDSETLLLLDVSGWQQPVF